MASKTQIQELKLSGLRNAQCKYERSAGEMSEARGWFDSLPVDVFFGRIDSQVERSTAILPQRD